MRRSGLMSGRRGGVQAGVGAKDGLLQLAERPTRIQADVVSHRRPDRAPFSEVLGMVEDPDAVTPLPPPEDVARAVPGSVIHDDDLFFDRDGPDLAQNFLDRACLVVNGHENGQFHGLGE